jgi:lipoyl synthase
MQSQSISIKIMPDKIRVSLGTAIVLRLLKGKLDAKPTTAYLMTYKKGKCASNCGFCTQARESKSSAELLSRVTWPTFATENVVEAIKIAVDEGKINRICIQALNYPEVFSQLDMIVKIIKNHATAPISISCQPINKDNIHFLSKTGIDRLGIALDAATES